MVSVYNEIMNLMRFNHRATTSFNGSTNGLSCILAGRPATPQAQVTSTDVLPRQYRDGVILVAMKHSLQYAKSPQVGQYERIYPYINRVFISIAEPAAI